MEILQGFSLADSTIGLGRYSHGPPIWTAPSGDHASIYTEEELRHLVDISRQSGHLKEEEQKLIHSVLNFSDAEVREAMIPRTSVDAIPITATLDEAKAAFRGLGYFAYARLSRQPR